MPIRLLLDLPAALVVCRQCDSGDSLILVNPTVPASRILDMAQALLRAHEYEALFEYLVD